MSVNRYTTVNWDKPMSSYVPLPLDALMKVGSTMEDRYNEGKGLPEELAQLGQAVKAAPMYQEHRDRFINDYNSKINKLVDEANGDYGNPDFKRKAKNLINEFKSRPELNAFANTLSSYNKWLDEKSKDENQMNLDWTYGKDNNGNFNQLDVLKQGVYNPRFTKYSDWNKAGKDIMGNIAKDGRLKEDGYDFSKPGNTRINNGETEVYNTKSHEWEGVTSGKLGQLSKLMVSEYANTEAGKHHLQTLLGTDIDYNTLSQMANSGNQQAIQTKDAIDKEFANHLYRSNANQVGMSVKDKLDYHFETNRKAQSDNDANDFGRLTSNIEQGNPTVNDIQGIAKDMGLEGVFDDNGNVNYDYATKSNPNNSVTYQVTYADGKTKDFKNKSEAKAAAGTTGKVQAFRDNWKSSNPEASYKEAYDKIMPVYKALGLKAEGNDYAKAVYNHLQLLAAQRSKTSMILPDVAKNMTDYYLGDNTNMHNVELYEQGNENSNAKVTNEVLNQLHGASKITGVDYYGKNQAGWKIAATPKDSDNKTSGVDKSYIAIPRDLDFKNQTEPVWKVSKGGLEFMKTGKTNDKYYDPRIANNLQGGLDETYSQYGWGKAPNIVATSMEKNNNGQTILRGTYFDPVTKDLKGVEYNYNTGNYELLSVDEMQKRKTDEITAKGALLPYQTKLKNNISAKDIK